MLTGLIVGVPIGLVLGWLFIPMPKAVADFYAKWFGTKTP